jgi:hypothetical protein
MKIKHHITLELDLSVEVSDIHVVRDGIGHYEYWGAKCFDPGQLNIEDFTIDEITILQEQPVVVVPHGDILKMLEELLYEDDNFIQSILDNVAGIKENV